MVEAKIVRVVSCAASGWNAVIGADLIDAVLRAARLTNANLAHANLQNANLNKADMKRANLEGGACSSRD
jgi:uncharacterized protein YjbI with pentapeptide repeats